VFETERAGQSFGDSLFEEIDEEFSRYELKISLLVAGFDQNGHGHIFSIESCEPMFIFYNMESIQLNCMKKILMMMFLLKSAEYFILNNLPHHR